MLCQRWLHHQTFCSLPCSFPSTTTSMLAFLHYRSWTLLTPKGLYLRWLEEPSGTPQVLGSTPRGSEFQTEVKKIPSLALCAKALVVSRPQVGLRTLTWPRQVVPRGYVSQCQGGARVRGFSRSGKPSLLLDNTGGAVFPHPAEFFFLITLYACTTHRSNLSFASTF